MKKYISWALLIPLFFITSQSFAAESPIQKIYKIESYKWNEINGSYEYLWHGSAVLIGKDKIITNAHVVLDDNNLPTGNYNLCISDNFETAPKCKTSLKLMKYDKTNDLAVLEPIGNISLSTPIHISERKLDLWETAKVYGYPANGGETITLTEGKVSGLDSGHYKIDANIDAGNSGGGAFDKNGDFIGIPYVASVGYSTLGYIIPTGMIQDFLSWKGDVTNYGKIDSKFLKYLNKINTSILSQKIDNPYIGFDGFQKNNFTLEFADEKPNSIISDYTFYSKTGNTTISLWINEIYGNRRIADMTNIDELKKSYSTVLQKRNIVIGGKKIDSMTALIGEKQKDGTIDKNIVSLFFDLGNIGYLINTEDYGSEKKSINAAISLFVKNLKIQKDIPLADKTHYINISGSFGILPDMNLKKSFDKINFFFDSYLPQKWSITIKKDYDKEWKDSLSNYTFEEMGKIIAQVYRVDDTNGDIQMEIKKNLLWGYYLDVVGKRKTGEIYRASTFVTKIDNIIYTTTITFMIPKQDSGLEKNYYQLVDTVNLAGKLPFKSAMVWVITKGSGQQ